MTKKNLLRLLLVINKKVRKRMVVKMMIELLLVMLMLSNQQQCLKVHQKVMMEIVWKVEKQKVRQYLKLMSK